MKVMYYVDFKVGFNQYASSTSLTPVASGVATHSQRWTIFDGAADMLALPTLAVAYLLF